MWLYKMYEFQLLILKWLEIVEYPYKCATVPTHPNKYTLCGTWQTLVLGYLLYLPLSIIANREMKLKSLALFSASVHASEQLDLSEIEINEPIRVKVSWFSNLNDLTVLRPFFTSKN